jgi:CSLREA domain-containing protein
VRRLGLLALLFVLGLGLAGQVTARPGVRATAFEYTVNSTADAPDASLADHVCRTAAGGCSLRAAIMEAAGKYPNSVTIHVGPGTYNLTIPATGLHDSPTEGDLDIGAFAGASEVWPYSIVGAGAGSTIIVQTAGNERIFDVLGGVHMTIASLTVRGGHAPSEPVGHAGIGLGAGIAVEGGVNTDVQLKNVVVEGNVGGGVWSASRLRVDSSIVQNNDGSGVAGALQDLTIVRSTISGNTGHGVFYGCGNIEGTCPGPRLEIDGSNISDNAAGGVVARVGPGGSVFIEDSVVHANLGDGTGGAGVTMWGRHGTLTVDRSEISANTMSGAQGTGGIWSTFDGGDELGMLIRNSTIHNNAGELAGALSIRTGTQDRGSFFQVIGSTISANRAPVVSGIDAAFGVVNLTGTILANTPATGNCNIVHVSILPEPPFHSHGGNIETGTSCGLAAGSDLSSTDPLLGPMSSNGGPTRTRALATGSPALDFWRSGGCPLSDQRFYSRPAGAGCDSGAFEAGGTQLNFPLLPFDVLWGVIDGTLRILFGGGVHTMAAHGVSLHTCGLQTGPLGKALTMPVDGGLFGPGKVQLLAGGGLVFRHGRRSVSLCNWVALGGKGPVTVAAYLSPTKGALPLFRLAKPNPNRKGEGFWGAALLTPDAARLLNRLLHTKVFKPGLSLGRLMVGVTPGPGQKLPPPAPPEPTPTPTPTTTAATTTAPTPATTTAATTTATTTTAPATTTATTTPAALPDLIVSDLQAFSATVKNNGTAMAAASVLRIAGVGDFKIDPLAVGGSQTVTWKLCVTPVNATADVFGQVTESDEGNNSTKFAAVCQ